MKVTINHIGNCSAHQILGHYDLVMVLTSVGYQEQLPPLGDVDLILALLRHKHMRLVLGVVNIADTVVEKINNLYKIVQLGPNLS